VNTPKRVLLFAACSFLLGLMAAGCNVSADPSGNTEPTPTAPLSTQAPTEAPAPTGNYDGYPEIQPDGTLMLNSDDILTPLLDAPVTQAMRSENQIFCITESGSLMQISPDGSSAVTLYSGKNQLRCLSCNGLLLYFLDGNNAIELNAANRRLEILFNREGIEDLYHWEDTLLYYRVGQVKYCHNLTTGETETVS